VIVLPVPTVIVAVVLVPEVNPVKGALVAATVPVPLVAIAAPVPTVMMAWVLVPVDKEENVVLAEDDAGIYAVVPLNLNASRVHTFGPTLMGTGPFTCVGHTNVRPPTASWQIRNSSHCPASAPVRVEEVTFPVRVIVNILDWLASKVGVAEKEIVVIPFGRTANWFWERAREGRSNITRIVINFLI